MRGNRRTKNTFVAIESRSLTESNGWRIPAANPRFLPTTLQLELAANFPAAPPDLELRSHHCHDPHPGEMVGAHERGDARYPLYVVCPRPTQCAATAAAVAADLIADRKARLPLRSSAKIATKALREMHFLETLAISCISRIGAAAKKYNASCVLRRSRTYGVQK